MSICYTTDCKASEQVFLFNYFSFSLSFFPGFYSTVIRDLEAIPSSRSYSGSHLGTHIRLTSLASSVISRKLGPPTEKA